MTAQDGYLAAISAGILALIVVLITTPLVMRLAIRAGAIDKPDDERRVHTRATPRLGGLAVLMGVLAAVLVFADWNIPGLTPQKNIDQIKVLLGCAVFVTLVGAVDDQRELNWKIKLGGQVAAACSAIFAPLLFASSTGADGLVLLVRMIDAPLAPPLALAPWFAAILSTIWFVALMNMMNFIDGVDGLAAGLTAINGATLAVITASFLRFNVSVISGALAGACVAFLFYNFRKGGARIFLGDSGSMLIGFLLAAITLQGVLKTAAAVTLVVPLALLAIPIIDTSFVVAKRVKYNLPISHADRWHLHHRLLNIGYSPRRVAVTFWLVTAALSVFALALRFVRYGNAAEWHFQGLAIVAVIGVGVAAIAIYMLVKLEIIKRKSTSAR